MEGDRIDLLDTPHPDLDTALAAGEDLPVLAGWPVRESVSLDSVTLHAPIRRPSKIWGVGYAYRDHREETGFTSTDAAPWYVIPADRKWFRNYLVARVIVRTLEKMDLQYPEAPKNLEGTKIP